MSKPASLTIREINVAFSRLRGTVYDTCSIRTSQIETVCYTLALVAADLSYAMRGLASSELAWATDTILHVSDSDRRHLDRPVKVLMNSTHRPILNVAFHLSFQQVNCSDQNFTISTTHWTSSRWWSVETATIDCQLFQSGFNREVQGTI